MLDALTQFESQMKSIAAFEVECPNPTPTRREWKPLMKYNKGYV
jgi:hypothetical protein